MKGRTLLIGLLILAISLFYAVNINAEAKGRDSNTFMGSIKEVDCKTGEIKMMGRMGEEVLFNLTEKTEFGHIKGCDEIKKDGRALIQFSDEEGKKLVKIIKYRPSTDGQRAEIPRDRRTPPDRREDLFMGWVGSVDCEKGLLILQHMDDRSKTESFRLEKDTMFVSNMKGCEDINTNSIVAIRYTGKGDDRIVKMIKSMIEQERK